MAMSNDSLRFDIDPVQGESARGCASLIGKAVKQSRGTVLFVALCAGVVALSFILPGSRASTALVGLVAVNASLYGLQAIGRANIRDLQSADPHSLERWF